jgi:hypothetical protein
MKKLLLFTAVLAAVVVLFLGGPAGAADTSPYLFGTWEQYVLTNPITVSVGFDYTLVNPTSSEIDYCVCFYDGSDGSLIQCDQDSLKANARVYGELGPSNWFSGVFKVIAMPKGKWTFDPNVVIGGFLKRTKTIGGTDQLDPALKAYTETESNLAGVVINSKTLPEFNRVMTDCRNTPR